MNPIERHNKIALQLSGGKDSVATLYLLRPYLDKLTVYYLNAGDEPPETKSVMDECRKIIPHFVEVRSDSRSWIEQHGFPSDVVPTSSSHLGRMMGFGDLKLSDRFSCCWANVMLPMYERMKADGVTLIIRGQKLTDMPKVPLKSGAVMDGIEVYYPLETWTDSDVFLYLEEVGAPIHPAYKVVKEGIGCMHCTGWWGNKSVDWLKVAHPEAYKFVRGKHIQIRAVIDAQMDGFDA